MRVLVEAGRAPPIDPGLCAAFRTATPDPNNLLANLRRSERSPYYSSPMRTTRRRDNGKGSIMKMPDHVRHGATRRDLIKSAAGVGLLATVGPIVTPRPAHAARKTLKIPAVESLRSRLRHVVQQSLRQGMGREERHRRDRQQHQSRADPLACRGRGVGAKRGTTSSCSCRRPQSTSSRSLT